MGVLEVQGEPSESTGKGRWNRMPASWSWMDTLAVPLAELIDFSRRKLSPHCVSSAISTWLRWSQLETCELSTFSSLLVLSLPCSWKSVPMSGKRARVARTPLTYSCRKLRLPTGALYSPPAAAVQPVTALPLVITGVSPLYAW